MNILTGHVINSITDHTITLVTISVHNTPLEVLLLEDGDTSLFTKMDTKVNLLFKENEILLTTSPVSVTTRNILPCTIITIHQGIILSTLNLMFYDTHLKAIIPTQSLLDLQLNPHDAIFAIIKSTDISLQEVYHGN